MMTAAGDTTHVEVDDGEEDFIVDIDTLQAHGINVADLKKLKTAGICTIRGLKMNTKKKLCQVSML
jgi:meiotic recombination protein DMC1